MTNYSGKDNLEVMETAEVYNNYLLSLLQKALVSSSKTILDFGAGTGFYAEKVQANNPSAKVVALEPADNLEEFYQGKNIWQVKSLAECSEVDFIYSFNVLEHIEDDSATLAALYEVLKEGGKLCLFVPAFPYLFSAMDKKVGHCRRYTRKELIAKVNAAGFKVEQCCYKDFIGWAATLAYKLLSNKSGEINASALKVYDTIFMPLSIWLDKITAGKLLGKNLWLEAVK